MAVAAELAPQFIDYQLVDSIPEAAQERQQIRKAAEHTLSQKRSATQQNGEAQSLQLPVDALSTADHVLQAGRVYGWKSPEHTERWNGLLLDCERLVGEWYRKKKPEYFKPVRHIFDADTEEFFSHGLSIRQMTENALVPISDNPEEEARRVNEHVEDATPRIIRSLGGLALGKAIRTVSECTDKAIADYAEDIRHGRKHRGYGGYVPEIEKVMVRDIRFDTETSDRFEEQIGLPGIYITHDIIKETLQRRGAAVSEMNKTELHGAQILVHDDLLAFVALLDTVASEQWCTEIFMGEEVPKGFRKNYAEFRTEAQQRQESLKDIVETVATFILDLAEDNTNRAAALVLVEEFVKKQLLELGKHNIAVVEQMFDTQTAQDLQEVARLESIGQYESAYALMQAVEQAAPGGGYCGAGSCGLETVNLTSEAGKNIAEKLKATSGDTVLKDKVRGCKCGSKSVYYAYNKSKVNKYCDACGAFESKASRAA